MITAFIVAACFATISVALGIMYARNVVSFQTTIVLLLHTIIIILLMSYVYLVFISRNIGVSLV